MRWHVYCCLLLVWSASFVRGGSGKLGPFFFLPLISTLRGKPASSSSSSRKITVARTVLRSDDARRKRATPSARRAEMGRLRTAEHTSEFYTILRNSYAVV